MDEKDILTDYLKSRSREYKREVPVGNVIVKKSDEVRGIEGPTSFSIDALSENTDTGELRIIEAKGEEKLNKRAIGQVLFYSYLFDTDRSIVREEHTGKRSKYEGYEHHVDREDMFIGKPEGEIEIDESKSRDYSTRPPIEEIHHSIVVGSLTRQDVALVSACAALGIDVNYRENGKWRRFDDKKVSVDSDSSLSQSSLKRKSKEELDEEDEEELAETVINKIFDRKNLNMYKEVRIGENQFGEVAPICDLVMKNNGDWWIVEVKSPDTDSATAFQKAFGQAVTYASLFSKIKGISQQRIIPTVLQKPVPFVVDKYLQERYHEDGNVDTKRMRKEARRNFSHPLVIG
jgi:hypothetical protein